MASSSTEPAPAKSPDSTLDLPRFLKNDPARTGFDPELPWWNNYFKIITGRVTPEGMFHYRESRYRANEKRDCQTCDEYRDWIFQFSPTVRFLREKIEGLNGRLDASNVQCMRCPTRLTEDGVPYRQTGGFDPNIGILVCANEIRNRKHLEDTLAHEMVHAYDHLRFNIDWAGNIDLRHAACTEIRASMLGGECRWTKEAFTRGNWRLSQQFQDCVRAKAITSVLARPACKDDVMAVKTVNRVWDSCFSDTRPFDDIYR